MKNDTLLKFKIIARRNKKIGMWAANLLGITPGEAEVFMADVLSTTKPEPDDAQLISELLKGLAEHGQDMSESQVRRQMDYFY